MDSLKILVLSATAPKIIEQDHDYNGRGWIDSYINLFSSDSSIKLFVAYHTRYPDKPKQINNVNYYPVRDGLTYNFKPFNIIPRYLGKKECLKDIDNFMSILNTVQPDIVHLFGSEWCGIRLLKYCKFPIVLHLQGIVSIYNYSFLPNGTNLWNLYLNSLKVPIKTIKRISFPFLYKNFLYIAKRELEILPLLKYAFGRTDWDKESIKLIAPNCKYFYINEILREPFYIAKKWNNPVNNKITILSTISDSSYKGLDVIFKTINVLKKLSKQKIEWRIGGISDKSESVKLYKKLHKHKECVKFLGILSAQDIIKELQNATLYLHPSHIENSANSICEAQYIGTPTIATNVGGTSSILSNDAGILVSPNDPYEIVSAILKIWNDKDFTLKLSRNEILTAEKRHDKIIIKKQTINAYKTIINEVINHNNQQK